MFVTACQKTQVVDESVSGLKEDEVALVKCAEGNPMAGKSDTGDYIYGGDPSVLVDGDTVYVYTGHDISRMTRWNERFTTYRNIFVILQKT